MVDRRDAVDDDLGLTPTAIAVLAERCLRRDAAGAICESPGQMMDRVAVHIAAAEDRYLRGSSARWAARYSALLRAREFLPNSPTLMNAGTPFGVLSGCFVLPIADSLESIFDTLGTTALLHQAGAGTGFSFSQLRRRGDLIASSGGQASGPVSFIELYDAASRIIRLGGRRRAANMAVLDAHHPDIEDFVTAKDTPGPLPTFNLSVGVTDDFMLAASEDRPHPLIDPRTGKVLRTIPARALLDRIAASAWRGGEPGLLFLDAVNRANPVPGLGRLVATNPCGEVPLAPNESCNLGSVNLTGFLAGDRLDEHRLHETVRAAVRFLDDVIDVADYPTPECAAAARATRKIGLGVMGLADTLAALGLPYDSEDAVRFTERLMTRFTRWAHAASSELAVERGPFPLFTRSRWTTGVPLRNAQVTSIAPTGTISVLANASAGIEPLYALTYTRHILGRDFRHVDSRFRARASELGAWTADVEAEVAATGTISACAGLPQELRRTFVTAHEIAPSRHIRMQAAVQRHIDAAVAKTINLPADTGADEVRNIFWQAWKAGVKGITVYRSGSRPGQVLHCVDPACAAYPGVAVDGTA
ncbi:adenosylcobalamin-dependent ribonucleoside-diphosphate reductase [Nocardia higoensis]|uniref:adenosylcobalamin-dependent ribonucleoside-diphosphate reductase n=1 Tax=Nocardia higoensis TaxID=228599 RepID=UPI0002F27BEC|nr:adenosylcobalamin-dependent ribonucleoside-diphosphate reductase [Nocardia higoensis]